ncbi:MAG: Hsp20/alpha crystallin family protein [Chloroflexota bacterium]
MKDEKQNLSAKGKEGEESHYFFSSVYRQWSSGSPVWHPPTDVFDIPKATIVRIEIAGMKDSEFTISLEGNELSVRGIRPDSDELGSYFQMEIHSGEFLSVVHLPEQVNYKEIVADYSDGFIQIVLPKSKQE